MSGWCPATTFSHAERGLRRGTRIKGKYVETHEHNVKFFVFHAGDLGLQLLSLWGIASTGHGCICLNN